MEFLKNVGRAVGEAAGYLREKNRRAAQLSRLRTVIHCHEKAIFGPGPLLLQQPAG